MKYTVVLAQSVPNELRGELAERLATRFGLTSDQAVKLAARKPGRLLKPTSKTRAETLLALYHAMGLNVQLEEIAEEATTTTITAAPSPSAPAAGAAAVLNAPVSTVPEVGAVSAPAAPSASSVWMDATVPVPQPVTAAVVSPLGGELPAPQTSATPTVERTFAEEPATAQMADEKPARRFSLRQRVLITTLTPLVLAGLASLAGSLVGLPQAQRQVMREGARALAASVGTTVDINDVNALDAQLKGLVQQPAVGFIGVNTPDGLQFFRSKNEDADFVLGEQVNTWIADHPGTSSFVARDKPADRFALQLKQLKESGVDFGNAQKVLEEKVKAPENQRVVVTNFELQQVNVYNATDAEGNTRKIAAPIGDPAFKGQDALYSVAVGVISDSSLRVTRQSVLLQILLTIVATAIAAFFAARTARRIVRPIENLVEAADKISLGQLDTPVTAERNDEIGDLARALERMRLSLEAAMERLRRRRNR